MPKRKPDKEVEIGTFNLEDSEPMNKALEIPVEMIEQKPKPEKPEDFPEPRLPRISLRVFEKIVGLKWDQFAGFRHHAKKNNLGPLTVPEWRMAFQAFKTEPTKPVK